MSSEFAMKGDNMKSVAMIQTKYWNNAYSVMRTANGLGFDKVYIVDLVDIVIFVKLNVNVVIHRKREI